ncbi:MAG: hypothetical protein J0H12_00150 [Candidatus Paracaedimonas acanthamoebae]|uniref:Uncharacterized protein n=1 Tax=Candidatus Paracaedimonas acanthamoebae TaxID=244581 RepID=A0A8J7PHT5_9PROT|nr:hypothetical protein [Candidatus Paracaedimonas acanthamoebae]
MWVLSDILPNPTENNAFWQVSPLKKYELQFLHSKDVTIALEVKNFRPIYET